MIKNLFLKKKFLAINQVLGFEVHYEEQQTSEVPNLGGDNTRNRTHHSYLFFIYNRSEAEEKREKLKQITDEKGVQAGRNALEMLTLFIHNPENGWEEDVVAPMNAYFESKGDPLPRELRSKKAKELLDRLVQRDYLDTNYQPKNMSRPEQAEVASILSYKLKIRNLWKVFGGFWGIKPDTMRSYHSKASSQPKTSGFVEIINSILR